MFRVWRNVIVLLVVAGGLAWLAIFGPRNNTGPETASLTALQPEAVTRIRLERPHQDPVVLIRGASGWRLRAPFEARANPIRAAALASLAGATTNITYDTAQTEPEALGLGASAVILQLNDTRLAIGTREDVRGLRYVRNANRVFLVQDRFYHHVTATSAGFVDPAVLDPQERVSSIVTPAFEIESGGNGLRWRPESAFASADDAATLLSVWRGLSALSVGFANYRAKWQPAATVTFDSGASVRFMYRTSQGRVWLMRPDLDLEYELPRSRAKTLFFNE